MPRKTIKKWDPEMTRSLVMQYEFQPILYQTTSPNYHNKVLRLKALEHIKNEINSTFFTQFTTEEITKKINNIRTQFLEVHRSSNKKLIQSGAGTDEIQHPSWWLYDQLQFLLPYCKKDTGHSNLTLNTSDLSKVLEIQHTETENNTETEQPMIDDSTMEGEFLIDTEGLLSPTLSVASSSSSSSNKIKASTKTAKVVKTKKQDSNINTAIVKAVEQIANEKPIFPSDIESLCNFVGHELMTLKNKTQFHKCKWDILKIVQQYQENEESD